MSVRIGKTGTIRVDGRDMEALRRFVFVRDKWMCRECGAVCSWVTGHLAHIKSRGAGGSDTPDNTRLLCGDCHRHEHQHGRNHAEREQGGARGVDPAH